MGKGGCGDAVDEDKIILCCALCCFNCGWYNACDACGISGKVAKGREGQAHSDVLPHAVMKPLTDLSFLYDTGRYLLLQSGMLFQAWSSVLVPLYLLGTIVNAESDGAPCSRISSAQTF
jgi:hypothetical protein